jgi:hypothetical protein
MTLPNHTLQALFDEVYRPLWVVTTTNYTTSLPAFTAPMNVFATILNDIATRSLKPTWCILSLSPQAEASLTTIEDDALRIHFGFVCIHPGLAGVAYMIKEVTHGH